MKIYTEKSVWLREQKYPANKFCSCPKPKFGYFNKTFLVGTTKIVYWLDINEMFRFPNQTSQQEKGLFSEWRTFFGNITCLEGIVHIHIYYILISQWALSTLKMWGRKSSIGISKVSDQSSGILTGKVSRFDGNGCWEETATCFKGNLPESYFWIWRSLVSNE